MRDMRILQICNNYGDTRDGVGDYAKQIAEAIGNRAAVTTITASCSPSLSLVKRLISPAMTNAFGRAIAEIESGKSIDVVIVEYPFVDCNPSFIIPFLKLRKLLITQQSPLVISIHEYRRVNRLRQMTIRFIAKRADALLVTNDEMLRDLHPYCQKIYIRTIPSNIPGYYDGSPKSGFVYFGLVNKAKAFDSLLSAWDIANTKDSVLRVLSATDVTERLAGKQNVLYMHNAPSKEVAHQISASICCVLPILPEVDSKNATFVTAISMGCICIGKFTDEFKSLPFVINLEDYSPESIAFGINKVLQMNSKQLELLQSEAIEYSKRFDLSCVADNYIEIISKILDTQ